MYYKTLQLKFYFDMNVLVILDFTARYQNDFNRKNKFFNFCVWICRKFKFYNSWSYPGKSKSKINFCGFKFCDFVKIYIFKNYVVTVNQVNIGGV